MAVELQTIQRIIHKSNVYSKHVLGRGTGLFATQDVPVRSQIFSVATPLIVALETSKLQDTCYHCFRSTEASRGSAAGIGQDVVELKSCMGCQVVKFCGKRCQTIAWPTYHKWECKLYARLAPRILTSTVRVVMRLLKQHKAGILPDGEFEQLLSLESHQDDLSAAGGQSWQNLILMAKAAKAYSGTDESIDVVLRICCILMLNSFTLTTPTFDPLGIVLHPLPALINHSCKPNAIVRFDISCSSDTSTLSFPTRYGSISIHALQPITKDDEITISYADATFPYSNRQSELKDRYFFTCTCPLCLQGKNAATDQFLSTHLGSGTPPNLEHNLNNTTLAEAQTHAESVFRSVQSKPGIETAQIANLKSALSVLAKTKLWPLHRYPYPQLRYQLFLALLGNQEFDEALAHSAILMRLVDPDLYDQPHHPVRMMRAWTLWNLCRCCMEEGKGGKEVARLLGLLSCAVLEGLVEVLGEGVGDDGELERMVKGAFEKVKEEEWIWREYKSSGEGEKERAQEWLDRRIQTTLVDELRGGST